MSANVVNYRNMKTRRTFLKTATLGATLLCAKIVSAGSLPHNANKVKKMKFPLVPLDYPYDALEPYIDAETVAIHHDKHQATYVDKLNAALTSDPGFSYNGSLTSLLSDLDKVPESMRSAIRNNGGGAWNHEFYWKGLGPGKSVPPDSLAEAINKSFGDFDALKKQLSDACVNRFGSGWGWLGVGSDGKLKICSTPNQDSPIMGEKISGCDMIPILTIDVWEHAYYLKYRNMRAGYVDAIWNIIDWKKIGERYESASKEKKVLI